MRAVLRVIWNGPFYIGQLSRPVSVGEVLLKCLETIWRIIILAAVIVSIVAASLAFWATVLEPRLFPRAEKFVRIAAAFDDGAAPEPPAMIFQDGERAHEPKQAFRCDKERPIRVFINNKNDRSIEKETLSISANYPGRSNNLASNGNYIEADFVVGPNKYLAACYALDIEEGADPRKLVYKAEAIYATLAKQ